MEVQKGGVMKSSIKSKGGLKMETKSIGLILVLVVCCLLTGCTVTKTMYPILSNHHVVLDRSESYEVVDLPEAVSSSGLYINFFVSIIPYNKDFISELSKKPGALAFVDAESTYRNLQIIPFLLNINTYSVKSSKILIDKNLLPEEK